MLHEDDHALHPGDEVHRPAHALHHLARDRPVGDVAGLRHLHRAQDGEVDMAASDHGEALGAREEAGGRQLCDRLLARIDQVGVLLALVGEGAGAQHAVFALKGDAHAWRDVVGDQGRDADPQVHVEAVLQLRGGERRHLVAGPALRGLGHQIASGRGRVVSFSMRLM
jgi:hypothetical protein